MGYCWMGEWQVVWWECSTGLDSLLEMLCWAGKVEGTTVPQKNRCQRAVLLESNFFAERYFFKGG